MSYVLKNLSPQDPPTVFMVEGAAEAVGALKSYLEAEKSGTQKIRIRDSFEGCGPGDLIVLDFKSAQESVKQWTQKNKTSLLVCGVPTQKTVDFVLSLEGVHLYLEDLGPNSQTLQKALFEVANFKAPINSYFSVSEEFLG